MYLEFNGLIVWIGTSFLYFAICAESLCYFVAKYKTSESEVLAFFQTLKYPLTLAFSDNPRFDQYVLNRGNMNMVEYITQTKLKGAILSRYFVALLLIPILMLIPISGFLRSEGLLNKLMYGALCLMSFYLSYRSWRFGHSLKPKSSVAQN